MNSSKSIGLIVEARLTSNRLPKKHLLEVLNKPILTYLIDRLKRIEPKSKIILAIPESEKNLELEKIASAIKEKKTHQHLIKIKKISESFKNKKNEMLLKEKEELKHLTQIQNNAIKEEIKNKLPLLIIRQKHADEQFIKLYKRKEILKEEKIKKEYNLNNIIFPKRYCLLYNNLLSNFLLDSIILNSFDQKCLFVLFKVNYLDPRMFKFLS
jgi:hypothetical protein